MKIFKLKLMKSELIRNKIPDVSKDAKSTHLHNNKKISNLNLDPLKFTNLVVLPSVRGWDNNN